MRSLCAYYRQAPADGERSGASGTAIIKTIAESGAHWRRGGINHPPYRAGEIPSLRTSRCCSPGSHATPQMPHDVPRPRAWDLGRSGAHLPWKTRKLDEYEGIARQLMRPTCDGSARDRSTIPQRRPPALFCSAPIGAYGTAAKMSRNKHLLLREGDFRHVGAAMSWISCWRGKIRKSKIYSCLVAPRHRAYRYRCWWPDKRWAPSGNFS